MGSEMCIRDRQVIVGQSVGLFISTAISDIFTAQSFSFVLILTLMLFGEGLQTVAVYSGRGRDCGSGSGGGGGGGGCRGWPRKRPFCGYRSLMGSGEAIGKRNFNVVSQSCWLGLSYMPNRCSRGRNKP